MDVGNLISGSSACSKSSLNIWKFSVQVLLKTSLKKFQYYSASVWDECNFAVVWMTEDEMVGWRHRLDGHVFEQAPGVGDGQGSLACFSPWGCKESATELNWTWTFFDIAFLWDWNENWPFPVLWPLLSFPNLLAYLVQLFHCIIF